MKYEWFIEEFKKKYGAPEEMNLANLIPVHGALPGGQQIVFQDQEGRYLLSPPLWLDIADWFSDLANPGVPLPNLDLNELIEIAQTLFQASDLRPRKTLDSKKATLYVPVDLRFSVSEQLDQQISNLKEVQSALLTLSGREGVFKIDREVIKKRLLCHVLRKYGGLSSSQIARVAFPGERLPSAATKVRNELRLVRSQLRKAGKGV